MRPFTAKDGRTIEPVGHEATFRGLHNSSKAKVLLFLQWWAKNHSGGLTGRQLNEETGVSLAYLFTRLTFWYRIRYLDRKAIDLGAGRPQFSYTLAARGSTFIQRIPPDRAQDYVKEINQWRRDHAKS